MSSKKKQKLNYTSVGGQAVLEGVMMQGKTAYCTAVRDPDGAIQVESKRLKRTKAGQKASRIPLVRGVVNMFSSLVRGMQALMRSAEVYGGDDEEPTRIEKWVAEKFKTDLVKVVSVIAVVLGVALAIALFFILPNVFVGFIKGWAPVIADQKMPWEYLILGGLKLVIFLAYLLLILLLKDIKRLYRYHGAEHKTINCYEKGLELTPENVMSCSRIHDRCGTSFLFIVLIINIAIIGVVRWSFGLLFTIENKFLGVLFNIGVEIVLLPVIAGVSYEVLKLLAKFHGKISLVFKAPGMLLQKVFTTREPDIEMVEVAIAAFNAAMAMDADPDLPETKFVTDGRMTALLAETKEEFKKLEIDESDAEWIYSIVLGVKRSELSGERIVKASEVRKLNEIIEKRKTGRPLWYIIGDIEFFGCKIRVDERALIPRPETEILADAVVKLAEEGDKILDLCTGSGCIAISVAKKLVNKRVTVTAADVSDAAIMLAKENANLNSVSVNFVESDMFNRIHGRFNIIVCNPPYIKSAEIAGLQKEVREHEPRIALDGGDDGLDFYRRLSKEVGRYIVRGGMLLLECGEGQAEDVLKMFEKREYAMVVKDLAGVDRFLKIAF